MWFLSHPLLQTGTLPELLAIFEGNRGGVIALADSDTDATVFLAYQALGVAMVGVTCLAALGLVVVVWSNVEAQLPGKSWFVFAAIHRLFRRIPANRLLTALLVPAIFGAIFASGAAHRAFGGSLSISVERPRLRNMKSDVNRDEIHLTVEVSDPVTVRAAVHRLSSKEKRGVALGHSTTECRPSKACKLVFTSRADSGPLAPGRYQLFVRATNEGGTASLPRTRTFRVKSTGGQR
jgi:hypothetical protein